ncbi:AAA family ATPase [Bailinhaonella thermotolerans]|uniref:AAA family ATPase n=1 Tax=Bailinhaonella thermotolerans TaxID=1070861 RepID=A0A3A4B0K0_9ACTN|nr:AAA family ATPase [Bailinhaonella thermotolerans]RJL34369.1 AAA family ATPase [Bailinhaonella thermotolerans]
MERVLVAGISGSGKTTMARAVAERCGLPRYELDALHHGPGWVKRPEFEAEVEEFSRGPRWVTEAQYSSLGDLLWSRADTVIWLDLPRRTVMARVVRRSLWRALTRRELWNGNRERWRDWLGPEHPIRWAWSGHARKRLSVAERVRRHPHLTVVRLRTAGEAAAWRRSLRPPVPRD